MIKKLKISIPRLENMKNKIAELSSQVKRNQNFQNVMTFPFVSIRDLTSLSQEQIQEIETSGKTFIDIPNLLLRCFSLNELVKYYKESKEKWEAMNAVIINYKSIKDNMIFQNEIASARSLDEVDSICANHTRKNILYGEDSIILEEIPERYQKMNKDILFLEIPDWLKEDYYNRKLTIPTILEAPEEFKKIPTIENFLNSFGYNEFKKTAIKRIGTSAFIELLKKYPDTIDHIVSVNPYLLTRTVDRLPYTIIEDILNGSSIGIEVLEQELKREIKNDIMEHTHSLIYYSVNGNYDWDFRRWNGPPNWMTNMFKIVPKLNRVDEIMEYTESTVILNQIQNRSIETVGIENIQRLQKETSIFAYVKIDDFLKCINSISFEKEKPIYEEFCKKLLHSKERKLLNYQMWSYARFHHEYPEIFLEDNAPRELQNDFYEAEKTLYFNGLYNHEEYIPYLKEKDFIPAFNQFELEKCNIHTEQKSYNWPEVINRLGKETFLKLVCKYGEALIRSDIHIAEEDFSNIEVIEKEFRDSIYHKIINCELRNYGFLRSNKEFVKEHPNIFINLEELDISSSAKERIESLFYKGKLIPAIIQKHPGLISCLKEKSLKLAFYDQYVSESDQDGYDKSQSLFQLENEAFLNLCAKYGRYIENIMLSEENKNTSYEELCKCIQEKIKEGCYHGAIDYQETDAPEFLRKECADLFLEKGSPDELKRYFYRMGGSQLNFRILGIHPEWIPYLEGKSVLAAMLRETKYRDRIEKFFDILGNKALSTGVQKYETVTRMIEKDKLSLLEDWYIATGKRFIPDFVVMENFSLKEINKYLEAGWIWNRMMKIETFATDPKSRESMLKVAYCLGAFESHSSKKEKEEAIWKPLKKIFMDLPRRIDASYAPLMEKLNEIGKIDAHHNKFEDIEIEEITKVLSIMDLYQELKNSMEKENLRIEPGEGPLEKIYQKNKDGSYSLRINAQSYPTSSVWARRILEKMEGFPILTSKIAGEYFVNFDMKYQPSFREFFLRNYESIIEDKRYLANISKIQSDFPKVERAYKNNNKKQLLNLDFACRQVEKNRFKNVQVGNEQAASEVAKVETNNYLKNGKRCYNQQDWEDLQEIYNEGKQRVTSSIPRIENKKGQYSYEILRLDDCLALTIGDRTDCCQCLLEAGASCMKHSMTNKHGRIFVVRDEQETIIAQSWVWRNEDILCFDNIEVPDQQMYLHGIEKGEEDLSIRNEFTDAILAVYQKAAREIIEEDNRVYKELEKEGKITKEQYERSHLRKATTGEGFSNILGSLKTLPQDSERVKPLPSGKLYTDSQIAQYILAESDAPKEEKGRRYEENTFPVFYDSYKEYSDKNFTETMLETLQKLEVVTKKDLEYSNLEEIDDLNHIVSTTAINYELNPEKTKIILHPNFAIIYEKEDDKVIIGDLLYNTEIKSREGIKNIENIVLMQMSSALNQIIESKEVDLRHLNEKQIEMFIKARNQQENIEIERGIRHAR